MAAQLKGKNAIVTGAARGIGKAIALIFAQRGANVVINDINIEEAKGVAKEVERLGQKGLAIKADVSNPNEVNAFMEKAYAELKRIDILVNNAGIANECLFAEMTKENFDTMLAVHLGGTFNCTKGVIQPMIDQKYGRIINIVSITGMRGQAKFSHYGAAKGGMISLTKCLAKEVGDYGITVNAVVPGITRTPILSSISQEDLDVLLGRCMIRRMGEPEEIGHLIAFLVSDEAAYITGQVMCCNGGVETAS